jgi:hypothetical protein
MSRSEVYISIDVETNGPIPGEYSMLSLGAAAITGDGRRLGTFSRNIVPLAGAKEHPETMEWWSKQRDAWEEVTKDRQQPGDVMFDFVSWIDEMCRGVNGRPVCVAYPAGFDFMFVYWYLIYFMGKSPFSFSCLDMKTLAAAKLGLPYRQATKRNWPRSWFDDTPHSHVAVEDAIGQGESFVRMLRHKSVV